MMDVSDLCMMLGWRFQALISEVKGLFNGALEVKEEREINERGFVS